MSFSSKSRINSNNNLNKTSNNYYKKNKNIKKTKPTIQEIEEENIKLQKHFLIKLKDEIMGSDDQTLIRLFNPDNIIEDNRIINDIINCLRSFKLLISLFGEFYYLDEIFRKNNNQYIKDFNAFIKILDIPFEEKNIKKIIQKINLNFRQKFTNLHKLLSQVKEISEKIIIVESNIVDNWKNIEHPINILTKIGLPSTLNHANKIKTNGTPNCPFGWSSYYETTGFLIDHKRISQERIYSVSEYENMKNIYKKCSTQFGMSSNKILSNELFDKIYQELLSDENNIKMLEEEKKNKMEIQSFKNHNSDESEDEIYDEELIENGNWTIAKQNKRNRY